MAWFHKHKPLDGSADNGLCRCGAVICRSQGPNNRQCNLQIGHAGPCQDTSYAEMGEWLAKPRIPRHWLEANP